MSLNLGNSMMQACLALRADPQFEVFRVALGEIVYTRVNQSLESASDQRIEATAYARALRDLWVAIESATLVQPQRTIQPPRKATTVVKPARPTDDPGNII